MKIEKVAEKLGVSERISEFQIISTGFKTVDMEGRPYCKGIQVFGKEKESRIKEAWEEKKKKNPAIFAGPLASIGSFWKKNGVLSFALNKSSFDKYDALRGEAPKTMGMETPLDKEYPIPLSFGAVTITAPDRKDPKGRIIFGVRSSKTAFGKSSSHPIPSGYINPETDKILAGDPGKTKELLSLPVTIIREMKEEIGIQEFKTLDYLGAVYDGVLSKNVLIAVRLNLAFTADELISAVRDMGSEIDKYYFIPNNTEDVGKFIKEYIPTPHGISNLILHFATE